jgi:hypothetical protein
VVVTIVAGSSAAALPSPAIVGRVVDAVVGPLGIFAGFRARLVERVLAIEFLGTVTLTEIGAGLRNGLLASGQGRFGQIVLKVDGVHGIVTSPSAVVTSITAGMSIPNQVRLRRIQ